MTGQATGEGAGGHTYRSSNWTTTGPMARFVASRSTPAAPPAAAVRRATGCEPGALVIRSGLVAGSSLRCVCSLGRHILIPFFVSMTNP